MKKLTSYLPSRRRLIQLYAALLYNAHLKGFISGNIYTGNLKYLCVPGLNCYSCPGAVGACPLGALQNALASSGARTPSFVLGILLLYGIIFGRTICGFLCPFGLIQELLHKIPSPKLKKNRLTRILSGLKYVILAVFVFAIPLWYMAKDLPVPGFCKYICPAGTLEGAVALLAHPGNRDMFSMLGILFARKFVILLLIIAACVFVYRAFCRFLCPLGAIYGLFSKLNIIGVKLENTKCIDCGKCIRVCPMDIRHVGDRDCIHCGECIDHCPTSAISFRAGKIVLRESELGKAKADQTPGRRRTATAAWAAALLLLAGVLYTVNRPESSVPGEAPAVDTTVAADFTVPLYGAEDESFDLSEHSGKTVIINFWATWCGPCVEELPHFDRLYREFSDEVAIVAIHSSLVTDNVEAWLAKYDYSLPFALDESGKVIEAYGGSTMLPQTVVIGPEGNVIYNAVGSVTYEELLKIIGK